MTRRRAFLGGLVAAALVAGAVWLGIAPRGGSPDVETMQRVRPGMTWTDVERVMGARGSLTVASPWCRVVEWQMVDGRLEVTFEDGRVNGSNYRPNPSSIERARDWLAWKLR